MHRLQENRRTAWHETISSTVFVAGIVFSAYCKEHLSLLEMDQIHSNSFFMLFAKLYRKNKCSTKNSKTSSFVVLFQNICLIFLFTTTKIDPYAIWQGTCIHTKIQSIGNVKTLEHCQNPKIFLGIELIMPFCDDCVVNFSRDNKVRYFSSL